MVRDDVGEFFWVRLEDCIDAFGVIIPSLDVSLGDDGVFVFGSFLLDSTRVWGDLLFPGRFPMRLFCWFVSMGLL